MNNWIGVKLGTFRDTKYEKVCGQGSSSTTPMLEMDEM